MERTGSDWYVENCKLLAEADEARERLIAVEQKLADLIVERDALKKRMAQITGQIVEGVGRKKRAAAKPHREQKDGPWGAGEVVHPISRLRAHGVPRRILDALDELGTASREELMTHLDISSRNTLHQTLWQLRKIGAIEESAIGILSLSDEAAKVLRPETARAA